MVFISFIFPKNYNFSFKLFGIFSYSSIFINLVYGFLLYFIISVFFHSFVVKFYIFIVLFIPVFLFSVLTNSNENVLIVALYVLKFFFRPKIYFYDKTG